MNEKDMVSQDQFDSLRKDVKEIKGALLGNSVFGQKGYLQRLEDIEHDVEGLKDFKNKLMYYTAGGAAVATLVVQLLMNLI